MPKMARMVSLRPEPTRPEGQDFAPVHLKGDVFKALAAQPSTLNATSPIGQITLGKMFLNSRPTIIEKIGWWSPLKRRRCR
jgi:hypothetical protein